MKHAADQLVKELVSSFKLVPRNLDAEEAKRLSSEAKTQRQTYDLHRDQLHHQREH